MPTTVLASIGNNSQTVTVNSTSTTTVTGFTNAYTVNLASAPTSSAKIGDKLISSTSSFLITDIAGSTLTVVGNPPFGTTTGAPVTGTTATISRAYSSAQTWEDAVPANLVTNDQLWIGEIYKEGAGTNNEWSIGAANWLLASGHTTDTTRYLWVRGATGQSFRDNTTKTTNTLRYNSANGVAITNSGNYISGVNLASGSTRLRLSGLQLNLTSSSPFELFSSTTPPIIDNCIVQTNRRLANGSIIATNSVFHFVAGYLGNPNPMASAVFTNCTIVGHGGSILMSREGRAYAGGILFKNCAVYNWTGWIEAGYDTLFSSRASWVKNFTDLPTLPGGTGTTGTVYVNQFTNITTSTADFRVIAGSNLINGGSVETATGGLDIIDQTRSTTTPTVGAWEYVALAGNMFLIFM